MNVILSIGNVTAEYGTEGEGYSPNVADDLHRHAVSTIRDLLTVATAVGAYRADAAAVNADEEDGDG